MWQSNRAVGQGHGIASAIESPQFTSLYILVSGSQWKKGQTYQKGDFLNLETFWTNLVIKHKVLTNIVTIAFALLGGRRSLPFPTRARVVYRCDVPTIVRAGSWHHCIDPCT